METVAIKKIRKVQCHNKPVYDITVPKYNNFILSNGLVVHNCKPYQYLKNTIYEERVEIPENNLLTEELLGLQRENSGKIDHDPSGVNCFTGDTKIKMLDGNDKTILQLLDDYNNNVDNYVYTFNHELKIIEPKKIKKVFKSGNNAHLVEVYLDNGETIRCTPEHRFMLRLGDYKEAQKLTPNESLMPLYTKYPSKGLSKYRLYYEPMQDKWHYEHRSFAKEIYDEKYLVHHKDCNPKNNRPDNLIWMSKSAHILEHSKLQTGAQSIEAKEKRKNSVKLSHKNVANTKNGTLRYFSGTIEERKIKKKLHDEKIAQKESFYNDLSKLFNVDFQSLDSETKRRCFAIYANYKTGKKVSFDLTRLTKKQLKEIKKENQLNACKYYNVDINTLNRNELHGIVIKYYNDTIPGYKEHIAQEVSKNHALGKYAATKLALADRIWWTNGKVGKENNLYLKSTEQPPANFWRGRTLKNHKVVAVKFIDDVEDVYDLEIEDNHNFALSAGVFVHNSKDSADAVCGAIWNASQNAEQYAFDYGESVETIVQVSSEGSINNRNQVQVEFEQELQRLFDPMSASNKNTNQQSNDALNDRISGLNDKAKFNEKEENKPKFRPIDFGMGPAQVYKPAYLNQGIVYW